MEKFIIIRVVCWFCYRQDIFFLSFLEYANDVPSPSFHHFAYSSHTLGLCFMFDCLILYVCKFRALVKFLLIVNEIADEGRELKKGSVAMQLIKCLGLHFCFRYLFITFIFSSCMFVLQELVLWDSCLLFKRCYINYVVDFSQNYVQKKVEYSCWDVICSKKCFSLSLPLLYLVWRTSAIKYHSDILLNCISHASCYG